MDPRSAGTLLFSACLLLVQACSSATGDETTRKGGVPAGVSQHFAGLLELHDPAAFRAAAAERGFVTTEQGVVLDIQTDGLQDEHRDALDLPGLQVRSFRPEYERISAVAARPGVVTAVAELPFVRQVAPSHGATTGGSSSGY